MPDAELAEVDGSAGGGTCWCGAVVVESPAGGDEVESSAGGEPRACSLARFDAMVRAARVFSACAIAPISS